MSITKEKLQEWREESAQAMHSALWEYCPKDEFNALCAEVERLQIKLEAVKNVCQDKAGHRLMQVAQPFREMLNLLK
jgi:hypothetical protein